jgi:hypothetical protein
MKYKIIAKLDEQKYKSCEDMDPNLWPRLKHKVYTLGIWPTKDWAEWSAKSHREYQFSNLDTSTVEIIEVDDSNE